MKFESVAVIVGGGENDVDDVKPGERLARGNLRGIDGGSGFADVDDFTNFLLVVEGDLDGRAGIDLDGRLVQGVEAFLLDVDVVLAGGKCWELAASGEGGLAAHFRLRGGLQGDAGGVDGYSVFVDDGDRGGGSGLSCGGADQDERKEESTHAVVGVFYGGMRAAQRRFVNWNPKFGAWRLFREGKLERNRRACREIAAKALGCKRIGTYRGSILQRGGFCLFYISRK